MGFNSPSPSVVRTLKKHSLVEKNWATFPFNTCGSEPSPPHLALLDPSGILVRGRSKKLRIFYG